MYTLNASRYLLVELPLIDIPMYAFSVLYELKLQGITPIIAHPERYSYVIKDPNLVYDFIDKGSLIQLNEGSLRGRLGEDIKKVSKELLNHHMVHMIGSDGHGIERRRPCMDKCYDLVKSIMGENYAQDLFYKNPEKICKNEVINIKEPIKIKSSFVGGISIPP